MINQDFSAPLTHRVDDACRRLGISRTTLYELIKSGEIKTIKILNRTLVPEEELQKVINSRMRAA